MALLTLENAAKGFNDRTLFSGLSLTLNEGERVGLLGPNGSGKSSLLKILAGLEPPDEGQRTLRRGLRLGYLEQEPELDPDTTVRDAARQGLGERDGVLAELEEVANALADDPTAEETERLLKRHGHLEHRLEELGGHDVEHRVESTLHSLGLSDFDARCGDLSGGERRRVALAQLLLGSPDLLLLDEPTNHLDALVTDWLEDWFLETKTPLLLVTHDRYFLDRVVDRIVELDRGQLVSYVGGYSDYLEARAARLETERRTELSRLNLLRRETAWMRRGPPARTTKAKARIQRYDKLVADEPPPLPDDLEFHLPPGPRLGDRVLRLSGVTKSYGDRVIVPPLDLELGPGTRLGIVGPNGAGKSTLIRMLLGELAPDDGQREIGETVSFMGIDQQRSDLDPDITLAEEVAGKSDVVSVGERTVRVESFLDRFGFPKTFQTTPISRLSGGEKNRVLLAKLMCAGGNVLVLDEPTNDLDLSTLRALEEALLSFPGSAVVVSHDRWFLDRVATQILYLDGEGGMRHHHGDLSGLLEKLAAERRERQARAARPKESTSKPGGSAKPAAKAEGEAKPKRLSPWEEKELGEVEERIPELEAALEALDARLADPELYKAPPEEAREVRAERERRDEELQGLYARWEELESRRPAGG